MQNSVYCLKLFPQIQNLESAGVSVSSGSEPSAINSILCIYSANTQQGLPEGALFSKIKREDQ